MRFLSSLACVLACALSMTAARAATLPVGQLITVDTYVGGTLTQSFQGTVGDGADVDMIGFGLYLNEGPAGDGFYLRSKGYYCGWSCQGEDITFMIRGLTFARAFDIDAPYIEFATGAMTVESPSAFSISWTNDGTDTQTYVARRFFEGRFVLAPVPLPAGAPMLGAGLTVFAVWTRHQRRKDRTRPATPAGG